MKTIVSLSRINTKQLVEEGKLVKIELYASPGDGFAQRLGQYLSDVASMAANGSSRTLGILDGDRIDDKDIKCFVDGDGADRIRDVKVDGKLIKATKKG